jgi:hypothetical protein
MSRLLSSARFKRRVMRWGGTAALIAVAVFVGIRYANTGEKLEKPSGGPVQTVPPTPKTVNRSAAEMARVRGVAEHFIQTAVYRRHLDEAWVLAAPSMRQGMTLSDWRTGNIPVVPYPAKDVAEIKWRLDYSFKRLVGMKIALVPNPNATQSGLVASMELTSFGTGAHKRWLVDAWVPLGGGQDLRTAIRGLGGRQATASTQPRLSSIWLILPFAIIGGIMLALPIGLGVRGWRRQARAQRAYSSTSRPS